MSLIAELTRRKVLKVGGAYLVIAWLAVQALCRPLGSDDFECGPPAGKN